MKYAWMPLALIAVKIAVSAAAVILLVGFTCFVLFSGGDS